jgi:hypothetical protein
LKKKEKRKEGRKEIKIKRFIGFSFLDHNSFQHREIRHFFATVKKSALSLLLCYGSEHL